MRELRNRYCGYKGSILKLCTGALSRLNSVKQLKRGEEYDSIRAVVESCVLVALSPKEITEARLIEEGEEERD